jgi:RNase adaptor protein for sRNA GlmZ degradation
MPRFKPATNKHLCVEVYSFSYKKGYPEDLTGNGGGFMFDCRYMHNPGRYIQYASLTGMDKPVIDFLEERGEVQPFLESALYNVKKAVERYHKRGFTHLQIGYGCTGGRHRSVYCAQKTAETLANLYPDVEIKLIHREQNIIKTFNPPNL